MKKKFIVVALPGAEGPKGARMARREPLKTSKVVEPRANFILSRDRKGAVPPQPVLLTFNGAHLPQPDTLAFNGARR